MNTCRCCGAWQLHPTPPPPPPEPTPPVASRGLSWCLVACCFTLPVQMVHEIHCFLVFINFFSPSSLFVANLTGARSLPRDVPSYFSLIRFFLYFLRRCSRVWHSRGRQVLLSGVLLSVCHRPVSFWVFHRLILVSIMPSSCPRPSSARF